MSASTPARGEVWTVDFDPTQGHEQAGKRPALVVSVDLFNEGPAGLIVVLPMTSVAKGVRSHIAVRPPEAGLSKLSYIKCEHVRSVSRERFGRRWGAVAPATLAQVEDAVRILLGL